MATGDNVLTAVAVARKCKIIPEQSEVYIGDMTETKNGKKFSWTRPQYGER